MSRLINKEIEGKVMRSLSWKQYASSDCEYIDIPQPACAAGSSARPLTVEALKRCCESTAECGGFSMCSSARGGATFKSGTLKRISCLKFRCCHARTRSLTYFTVIAGLATGLLLCAFVGCLVGWLVGWLAPSLPTYPPVVRQPHAGCTLHANDRDLEECPLVSRVTDQVLVGASSPTVFFKKKTSQLPITKLIVVHFA